MRLSRSLILIFLCFVCTTTKKIKDDDFAEFDDFDQDEFVTGMFSKKTFIFFLFLCSRNSINNSFSSVISK
jgi:hypothetical protein